MSSIVKASIVALVLLVLLGVGAIYLFQGEGQKESPAVKNVGSPQDPKPPKVEPKKIEAAKAPLPPKAGEVMFTVRVFDESTKKLLAKASLLVQKITDGDRPGEKLFESGRMAGSGGTGEFQVSVPPGVYQMRAQCPGYSSKTERITAVKDRKLVFTMELGRGNSISGRVLSRENKGIGGAKVYAFHQIGDPQGNQLEKLLRIIDLPKWNTEPPVETVSAADGSYQLDGLERKYYSVKALAAGFSPAERRDLMPTKDGVDLKLDRGADLSGVVVDPAGAGVEGAKVMAYAHVDSSDLFTIIENRSRPPMETAVTGAGGAFKFDNLGLGTYNFLTSAKGFQEGRFQKIRIREGENPAQRFVVSRGLAIAGVVVSAQNEPLQGAKVRATRIGDTGRSENMVIRFDDGSIVTDAQGKFALDTLEAGKYTLLAWHPEYATEQKREVDAGSTDLVITLPLGGAISGTITEAGTDKPVVGARVFVSDMQDLRKEGISDEKGLYVVSGLNSQSKRFVNVQAEGYSRISNVQISVEDNKLTEGQNFELLKTASVSGRVVNSSGAGIASARIMAKRKEQNAAVQSTVGSSITDAEGRYQIRDLEAGESTLLSIWTSDYLEGESEAFSVQPGESKELPDITLRLGGIVQGTVMGLDNKGLPGVQVSVREEGKTTPDMQLSGSSDAKGQFTLRGLPSGTVDLVAHSNHYLEEVVAGVKVEEGLITKDVQIVLRQGSFVKGIVLDSADQPLRGATVTAHDVSKEGMKELRAETEQDGNFAIENILAEDKIEIEVEHPDYGSWAKEVPVNTDGLKVVLPKLGGVSGVVLDPEGKPVASFSVQPLPKGQGDDGRRRPQAKTFSATVDGAFEYTGIPPGVYDINIRAPSYAAFTFPDVQIGGKTLDLGKSILQEGGLINGVINDEAGQPVAGAIVRVIGGVAKFNPSSAGARSPTDQSVATTDARGVFEFRNLKAGTVSLSVNVKGFVSQRIDNIDSNLPDAHGLRITLQSGSEIYGSVLDANGVSRNGVSVYLSGERPESNQRSATNSEGQFRFVGLSPGKYRVTAQRIGEQGANPSVEVDLEPSVQQEVELVFE